MKNRDKFLEGKPFKIGKNVFVGVHGSSGHITAIHMEDISDFENKFEFHCGVK